MNGDPNQVVATVHHASINPTEEVSGETRANAHLIAAAPELLEALKASHAWLERLVEKYGENFTAQLRALHKSRCAIEKAEGRMK